MSLERILESPGLFWIGEKIFIEYLESDQKFAECEFICKLWRKFFINSKLWQRRLFTRIAAENSEKRRFLNTKLEQIRPDFDSLEEQNRFFRSLAFQFSQKSILASWKNKKFSIKKVSTWPIVRDLGIINGSELILAQEKSLQIVERNLNSIENRKEFNMNIKKDLKGHRREVTCFDFDKNVAVAGGRDRNLTIWNIKKGSNLGTIKDAHDRLITCVKIYKGLQ